MTDTSPTPEIQPVKKSNKFKEFLRRLNDSATGFRGILAIWTPIGYAYVDAVFSNVSTFDIHAVITAAKLAMIPTVKLIWTDAIPKMRDLYNKWLKTP